MLPLSFLLLVLVLALPVGAPCPSPGQKCSAADIAVKEGDTIIGIFSMETGKDSIYGSLYVRPDASFQGVTVVVQGSHGTNGVWFPIPSQCFPDRSSWWEMQVKIWIEKKIATYEGIFVAVFVTRLEGCTFGCSMNVVDKKFYRLEVAAHGPSSWRMTAPNASCPTVRVLSQARFSLPTCQGSPSSRSPVMCPTGTDDLKPSTPSPSPMHPTVPVLVPVSEVVIVVIVVVVVVVVGVVVGVIVTVKVRTSLAQRTPAAPATTVSRPAAPSCHPLAPPAAPRGLPHAVLPPRPRHDQGGPAEDDLYDNIYDSHSELYLHVV
ncbi:uncharacterized protein LOC135099711 isoform X2 [Scylla paramamosain]|uniref:uncharacterized protein LOC135099711 isoform X2 n=1 Tax=Scylla paramamosain TaxID=85552 RepID=UPI003082F66E